MSVGLVWYGVDIHNEGIADNYEASVWEPSIVKRNAITAACEAACLILSVDETIFTSGHRVPDEAEFSSRKMTRGQGSENRVPDEVEFSSGGMTRGRGRRPM